MLIINLLIDYLTISIREISVDDMFLMLNLDINDCTHRKSCFARFGMSGMYWFNGIKLHYGEYIILDMSGSGCRTLETLYNNRIDWVMMINIFLNCDGHISRLDIAVDDRENKLNFKKMFDCMEKNKYITNAQKIHYIKGSVEEIIIGSTSSNKLIRIYNKALERGYTQGEHWIRTEIQLRNDCAAQFWWALHNKDIGKVYGGTVLNLFRFITKPYNRQNSNRYQTASWWTDFLETTEKIHNIKVVGSAYNEFNVNNYVEIQAISSIKTYLKIHQGNVTQLLEKAEEAEHNEKQKVLLFNQGVVNDESYEKLPIIYNVPVSVRK